MPRTKAQPTNAEALDQVEDAVARVMTLISAVLRKYPQNTLPEKLMPFRYTHADRAVRRATKGDDIVLASTSYFYKTATLRFPLALLDAPEQVITRWARDQYWSAIEGSKFQARQEARVKVAKARETLEKAQRDLDAAAQNLTEVSVPGKKKRQA
ncbi:hypothetical protein [Arthrobacter sp. ES1]|uniref:hypothetical protein n=1 Tax=Arthrobacter sp. ES1 TaxID=1897056 RepID=UPI001CFFE0F5|nr:hypothetical protein [Arthrobacter sp. ES1]MCB5280483.1 hypothetical protein [Arthrobacter sp. ES1]